MCMEIRRRPITKREQTSAGGRGLEFEGESLEVTRCAWAAEFVRAIHSAPARLFAAVCPVVTLLVAPTMFEPLMSHLHLFQCQICRITLENTARAYTIYEQGRMRMFAFPINAQPAAERSSPYPIATDALCLRAIAAFPAKSVVKNVVALRSTSSPGLSLAK